MITGIHSAQKRRAYRTQCNCNQSVTKLRATADRHSKWADEGDRDGGGDDDERSGKSAGKGRNSRERCCFIPIIVFS